MVWTDEVEQLSAMKELLDTYWVAYEEIPKPELVIVNDVDEAISRVNIGYGDYVLISIASPEQIRPRGNFTYQDRISSIMFSILTKESRQRMRNIYKQIRAICGIHKHTFTGWQLIRPMSHRELFGVDLNIWRGELVVQLENHAVAAETAI